MLCMELVMASNRSWNREEFFYKEVTKTAIWPNMFAFIIAPPRIAAAANAVSKVVRGPTSLPVSMSTEW